MLIVVSASRSQKPLYDSLVPTSSLFRRIMKRLTYKRKCLNLLSTAVHSGNHSNCSYKLQSFTTSVKTHDFSRLRCKELFFNISSVSKFQRIFQIFLNKLYTVKNEEKTRRCSRNVDSNQNPYFKQNGYQHQLTIYYNNGASIGRKYAKKLSGASRVYNRGPSLNLSSYSGCRFFSGMKKTPNGPVVHPKDGLPYIPFKYLVKNGSITTAFNPYARKEKFMKDAKLRSENTDELWEKHHLSLLSMYNKVMQAVKIKEDRPELKLDMFSKVKRDLTKCGRITKDGQLNFELRRWLTVRHYLSGYFHNKSAKWVEASPTQNPTRFYKLAIGWPLLIKNLELTTQACGYSFESTWTAMFPPSFGINNIVRTGHGPSAREANNAAALQILYALTRHKVGESYCRIEDFLTGGKFGAPPVNTYKGSSDGKTLIDFAWNQPVISNKLFFQKELEELFMLQHGEDSNDRMIIIAAWMLRHGFRIDKIPPDIVEKAGDVINIQREEVLKYLKAYNLFIRNNNLGSSPVRQRIDSWIAHLG
ncbi:hypothetical protein V1514DRAFT_330439 [Lipomyces japonicus]|uniref:uncharacterized protein n=1 Tax=Lipomyces japonicus TaxID=56871 RepID=UPI0034CD3B5C